MDAIKELIEVAAARGVTVDETEADHVLLAERILQVDPEHAAAKEVVKNFGVHLRTGKNPWSFAGFVLREPELDAVGS
jgi:hypothetical protein